MTSSRYIRRMPARHVVRISLFAAAALTAFAGTAQAQSALDKVMQSKLIKIAIPTDFPPYGSVGADMQPRGLDIDMASYIAEKLGVKVELVPVSTANRIAYLQTKKVDLVISTLGKNPEREKVIDFTVAYSPFFISVFGPKATAVKVPADLAGKTIAVTRGSVDDQELTKVAPAGAEVRRFEDNAGTVSAYVSSQTQLIATSIATAASITTRNPQTGIDYKFGLKDSPNFVGVAKGEEALRQKVNDIIMQARKSGETDKLSVKWLGKPAGELPQ
ncbi:MULTISPECIES: transporter substrate-binding domain-containing protein [unclassified Variovorax]|uniref:transporter substrate-binding domain-containing protein n=1 Tax=unclassified Variovorax TaxID=663243 RepID=UPI003F44C4DB